MSSYGMPPAPFFQIAQHLDLRCVLLVAVGSNVPRVPTENTSRVQILL